MEKKNIYAYKITHLEGDPRITKKRTLELGHDNCMQLMRPRVNKGDLVIAQLGINYYKTINGKKTHPYKRLGETPHLFYAMEVTSEPCLDEKGYRILCSKKGSYHCYDEHPIKIDRKFNEFLTNGQSGKGSQFEGKLANEFMKFASQKSNTDIRLYIKTFSKSHKKVCS
ncbi:MAG TPA: hypothetical protein ENH90_01930 [bacterium]|nr:hypothetical protein [bacterium]